MYVFQQFQIGLFAIQFLCVCVFGSLLSNDFKDIYLLEIFTSEIKRMLHKLLEKNTTEFQIILNDQRPFVKKGSIDRLANILVWHFEFNLQWMSLMTILILRQWPKNRSEQFLIRFNFLSHGKTVDSFSIRKCDIEQMPVCNSTSYFIFDAFGKFSTPKFDRGSNECGRTKCKNWQRKFEIISNEMLLH